MCLMCAKYDILTYSPTSNTAPPLNTISPHIGTALNFYSLELIKLSHTPLGN